MSSIHERRRNAFYSPDQPLSPEELKQLVKVDFVNLFTHGGIITSKGRQLDTLLGIELDEELKKELDAKGVLRGRKEILPKSYDGPAALSSDVLFIIAENLIQRLAYYHIITPTPTIRLMNNNDSELHNIVGFLPALQKRLEKEIGHPASKINVNDILKEIAEEKGLKEIPNPIARMGITFNDRN